MPAPLYTYELIGSNGDRIIFDNVQYAVLSEGLSGLSGYPVEYATSAPVGHIGEVFGSQTIGKRLLSIPVAILDTDGIRGNLEARRQRLISALNPLYADCRIVWHREDGTTLWCKCRVDDGSPLFREGTLKDSHAWLCDLDMVALDPCWYSAEVIESELRGFVGGWHLPFSLPMSLGGTGTTLSLLNIGDTPTPCTIRLRGYLDHPVITNLTTGESITVRKEIKATEMLIIDTSPGTRSVTIRNLITGAESNALSYTTIGSTFFTLPAGQVRVTYTATAEGAGAIGYLSFSPRWLSI